MNPVTRAITAAGGRASLAKSLGISAEAVRKWELRGAVPAKRLRDVERVTGIPRKTLNPSLYALV